jgi:hypothetical protein
MGDDMGKKEKEYSHSKIMLKLKSIKERSAEIKQEMEDTKQEKLEVNA